jgi:pimeloyl-ACP methyl ester carboxylesterase
MFTSVVMMSAPFGGAPALPLAAAAPAAAANAIYEELARPSPPRKHYQRYYQTREANADMWRAPQGLHIMDLGKTMADHVAAEMPTSAEIAANRWLPDRELRVYTEEYGRTGFQGGLNGYRGSPGDSDLQLFAGKTLDVPSAFISGKRDWGIYQNPGALDRLEKNVTTNYRGTQLIDGAGHWVQQEKPEALTKLLLDFLR